MERAEFLTRLRGAAVAAWWCVLVGWLGLALSWAMLMVAAGNEDLARLVRRCWGDISLAEMLVVWLLLLGVGKLLVFGAFLGALFLTLWHRRLRRAD